MLCSRCSDLFAGKSAAASSETSFVHHEDLTSFRTSALAGCHLCYLLATRFELDASTSGSSDAYNAQHALVWQTGNQGKRLYFSLVGSQDIHSAVPTILRSATFDVIPASELELAAISYIPTATTVSESSIALARDRWYQHCLKHHDYCNISTKGSSFLPTRLLDVETGDLNTVKLIVTGNMNLTTGQYVSLSHCWGKSRILKLETTNLEEFVRGISLQRLPKTFRDTVQVTKDLGFRYLWIDSLCILQDSKEDWLIESALMGKIYRFSTLNIAATAASGGDVGLDFPRDPILSQHLLVTATWNSSPAVSKSSFLPDGDYYLVESDFWLRDVDRAPLNTRGWVLQERLLSPRILHFGRNQLYWQCGLDALCEMFPVDAHSHRLGVGPTGYTERDLRPYVQVLETMTQNPAVLSDAITMEEAYQPWRTLIATYSEMQLTKGEDKLIAIQALAQVMETAVQDRYVAGFWESRLVEDMLWRVAPSIKEASRIGRPQEWRAPTWSWASVDGTIVKAALTGRYAGRKQFDGTALIKDIRVTVDAFNGLTTGQLRSASLEVEGCLLKSLQQPLIAKPVVQEQTGAMSHLSLRFESTSAPLLNIWPDEFDWTVDSSFTYTLPPETRLLPVGKYEQAFSGRKSYYIEGLFLVPEDQDTWLRLGYFSIGFSSLDVLTELFQTPAESNSHQPSEPFQGKTWEQSIWNAVFALYLLYPKTISIGEVLKDTQAWGQDATSYGGQRLTVEYTTWLDFKCQLLPKRHHRAWRKRSLIQITT